MNAKIIITLLCATQLVAGFGYGYDVSGITSVLNSITAKITDIEKNVHDYFDNKFYQTISQAYQQADVIGASTQTAFDNEVAKIENGAQDISDCVAAEKSALNDTVKAGKQAIQDSAAQVQNQIAPVAQQGKTLFTNALTFVNTTKQQLTHCAQISLLTQFPCYAQIVPTATIQGTSLIQQIAQFDVNAKIAAANALIALQNAAQQNISSLSSQLSAISNDAMTCIQNKLAATTTAAATTAAASQ